MPMSGRTGWQRYCVVVCPFAELLPNLGTQYFESNEQILMQIGSHVKDKEHRPTWSSHGMCQVGETIPTGFQLSVGTPIQFWCICCEINFNFSGSYTGSVTLSLSLPQPMSSVILGSSAEA